MTKICIWHFPRDSGGGSASVYIRATEDEAKDAGANFERAGQGWYSGEASYDDIQIRSNSIMDLYVQCRLRNTVTKGIHEAWIKEELAIKDKIVSFKDEDGFFEVFEVYPSKAKWADHK